MKNLFIILLFLFLFVFIAKDAFATMITCSQAGGTTFCSDGSTYSQIGNTIFGSDGSTYSKVGNTVFGNSTYSNNNVSSVNPMMTAGEQQTQTNNQKEASLKSTFGLNNFYSCYSSANGCDGTVRDLTSPYNMSSCLIAVEGCLERAQIAKESSTKNSTSCSYGYVKKNGECVTYDQSCNISFPNSVFLKINSNDGSRVCDCTSGYQWNDTKTSCVTKPIKTNDQICIDSYGPSRVWAGTKDAQGRINCDCASGYQWNQDSKSCVVAPVKTNDQKTVVPPVVKNTLIDTKEIKVMATTSSIVLTTSTSTNSNINIGTTTPKVEVKPRSLWSKLKGLFGFK